MTDVLIVDGQRFLRNASGVFEVPAVGLGALTPYSLPARSTVSVQGLPQGEFFKLSMDVTHAGNDEAFAFVHVSFTAPRTTEGQSMAERRVTHVRKHFAPLVRAGWKDGDDQRFNWGAGEWYWMVLYANYFRSIDHNPPIRELCAQVSAAFLALLASHDTVVFICYASEDRSFVDELVRDLQRHGLHIWYDQKEIAVGDSIIEKINFGLDAATHLVVVLSEASVIKPWVQRELSASLMRQLADHSIKVLPLLRDNCAMPPLLKDIKYADFRADAATGLAALVSGIVS